MNIEIGSEVECNECLTANYLKIDIYCGRGTEKIRELKPCSHEAYVQSHRNLIEKYGKSFGELRHDIKKFMDCAQMHCIPVFEFRQFFEKWIKICDEWNIPPELD